MTRARILADYVSTGVTAAEFDFLDTTSGTPGRGNFLRGDKTWAGAGVDGVTTGSGNVTITNGNLILGTSGKGIDFSATADTSATGSSMSSELLDDYEEGTWTPGYSSSGSSTGTWDSTLTGTYTKIGRVVTINLKILGVTMAFSATNGYRVYTGLPFAPATGGAGAWATPNSGFTGSCRATTTANFILLAANPSLGNTTEVNGILVYHVA